MRAVNIEWDADGQDPGLPTEMQVPCNIPRDSIADYLSDQTGWLVQGFAIAPDESIRRKDPDTPFLHGGTSWTLYRLETPADLADVCFALYGEARMPRIERMRDAVYPCWALFTTVSGSGEGRCEGPVDKVIEEIKHALSA